MMYSLLFFFRLQLLVGQPVVLFPTFDSSKVRAAKVQPEGPREAARQEPVRLEDEFSTGEPGRVISVMTRLLEMKF